MRSTFRTSSGRQLPPPSPIMQLGLNVMTMVASSPTSRFTGAFRGALSSLVVAFCFSVGPGFADSVLLCNGQQQLVFDGQDGRWLELSDVASKQNFVGHTPPGTMLWQLHLSSSIGQEQVLAPDRAAVFRVQQTSDLAATLVWEEFQLPEAPQLRVRVHVELAAGEASSAWHLVVEHLGALQPQEVRFPQLHNISSQDQERLAVPLWMGQVAPDPRALLHAGDGQGRRLEFDYPGHTSLQSVAWYRQGGPGFYLSCDDTRAFRKSFVFEGNANGGADCWLVHLPENGSLRDSRRTYELPYRVVIGTFRGDWYTVAERYRDWATNQVSAAGQPTAARR